MAARPAALAVALAAASSCARGPPPLTEAQLQALSRWDTHLTGEVRQLRRDAVLEEGGLATAVSGSRHGELVAFASLSGDDATLTAIDRKESPRRLWTQKLNAGRREVPAVEVAPDGSMVASAGRDGFVRTFDAKTGTPRAALGLRQPLASLAMRADGGQLAVGTAQGRVVILTFPGLEQVASAELHGGQEVRGLAYRADSALLSGGWDRTVVLSRLEGSDLREERRHLLDQYVNDVQVGGGVVAVALSAAPAERPPGEMSQMEDATPANAAALLDATTLVEVLRPVRHRGAVSTVAMAADGQVFVSGGWDGQVLVERRDPLPDAPPEQLPLVATYDWFVRRVRLTRDGRYLLVAAWTNPLPQEPHAPPSVTVDELVRKAPEVVREPPAPRW